MPFIPVMNVGEFRMQFTYFGQLCENVYHVFTPGGWDVSEMTEMAAKFRDWWIERLKPNVSGSLTLRQVEFRDLTTASGIGGVLTTGLPQSGENDSPGMPGNVTVSVKWITGFVGRSFRGRTYHLGLCESQCVGNNLLDTYVVDLQGYYNFLIPVIQSTFEDAELVVVSRFSGVDADGKPIPRATGIHTVITSAALNPDLDSQRRRLNGRGL